MDIESNRLPVHRRISKGWKLLGKYKRHVLGVLLVGLEMVSLVLDVLGKTKLVFVLGAFLLSVFGFGVTIYTCISERIIAGTRLQAEKQLEVVDIAFSVVQLAGSFIHFVLTSAGVQENYSTISLFPLVFAIIVVVFIFKNDKVDHSEPSSSNHLPTPQEGESSIDASDWRSLLKPDSRPRIISRLTDTFKRHLPHSALDGLDELERIAMTFEEKMYLTASSVEDYLRKISLKMLTLESSYQTKKPSPVLVSNVMAETNPLIQLEHTLFEEESEEFA